MDVIYASSRMDVMKMMHMVQKKIPKTGNRNFFKKNKTDISGKNESCHRHDNDVFEAFDDQQSILFIKKH